MPEEIVAKAQQWVNSNIDEDSRKEIETMLDDTNKNALEEAFYKDLEFGTGGLRGVMGVGSNRINKYTIGMATQGLSNHLLKTYPGEDIKVAVAHDSRNNSRFFAETTAAVFSANGITVYFFEALRPTPELSFAIRHFGCQSGVVLTASHNPKKYNGYKAYWSDGGQLVPPHDKDVITEVKKIQNIDTIKFDADESKIITIGKDVDALYLAEIKKLSLAPEAVKAEETMKIVFSPIHGTGITLVPECLANFGFKNVHVVQEQAEPDGDFPTVVYPNPEEADALKMALDKAKAIDADLVMATDPDADRVGIAVKNHHGDFQLLNGNQTGSLLIYYLLQKWKENGKLDGNQYVVKTIVTTGLIEKIAQAFDVTYYNTLTGFKYIAMVIKEMEGKAEFIGGGEESYGYMIGDFVRDKDAVASCAMIAEMTAYAKHKGLSLFDMLLDMYAQFGFYKENLISITKEGKAGAEEIQTMMKDLRENPPATLAGSKVAQLIDYQSGSSKNLITGEEEKLNYPSSNVLQFLTEDGALVSARPSGTEPKIKFYFSVNTELKDTKEYDSTNDTLDGKINTIKKELSLL